MNTSPRVVRTFVRSGLPLCLMVVAIASYAAGLGPERLFITTLPGKSRPINAVAFSPDVKTALTANSDGILTLWDLSSGKKSNTLVGHDDAVSSVVFSVDGKYVLSGSWDRTLKLWNAATGQEVRTFEGHTSRVTSVALSRKLDYALSGSWDKTVRLWDIATGNEERSFVGHTDWVTSVAFSPDGRYALSGSLDRTARLWDVSTGKLERTLKGHSASVNTVAFSSDGKLAASGGDDNLVKIWDLADLSEGPVYYPGRNLDGEGKYLWDVLDASARGPKRTFRGHSNWMTTVAFSPDPARGTVLSGSRDGSLRLWDVSTGTEQGQFIGHKGPVLGAAVSKDGELVLSGGADGTARLWNLYRGREVLTFFEFGDGEWLSATPEGFFASSGKGEGNINVRTLTAVLGLDYYRSNYNKAGIVEAALKHRDSTLALCETLTSPHSGCPSPEKSVPPRVVRVARTGVAKGKVAQIAVTVSDAKNPIAQISVRVNNEPARIPEEGVLFTPESAGKVAQVEGPSIFFDGNDKELTIFLPLVLEDGWNTIAVSTANAYIGSGPDASINPIYHKDSSKLPNLRILAVGVNGYNRYKIGPDGHVETKDGKVTRVWESRRDPKPLWTSANDAKDVVAAFKRKKGEVFNEVNSAVLVDNFPSGEATAEEAKAFPTRKTIAKYFDSFFGGVGKDDIVVLYLSGHGQFDPLGNWHFLPVEFSLRYDENDPPENWTEAISAGMIRERFLNLTQRKILIVDACYSEGIKGSKGMAQKVVDEGTFRNPFSDENAAILASSSRYQQSQSSPDKLGHSLFTGVLLDCLQSSAKTAPSGSITLESLGQCIDQNVRERSKGTQFPIVLVPPKGEYRKMQLADTR